MHKWITVTLFPREDVQPVRHRWVDVFICCSMQD
jgi:hypothetical protein